MDNCVGQNKSQLVMRFFAFLSMTLFKFVRIIYLIPGHSHMATDRAVHYAKQAIRGHNVYHPTEFVDLN